MKDTRTVMFGASLTSPNLGVNALAISALQGLTDRLPTAHFYLFDHGKSVRPVIDGRLRGRCTQVAARWTRNRLSADSLSRICFAARFGTPPTRGASLLRETDCAFEINGGDSFTDLYGEGRFHKVVALARAALAARKPLVFLPQTIGPFTSARSRSIAKGILTASRLVVARDADSYARAEQLMPRSTHSRLRLGVDLAFLLPRDDVTHEWLQATSTPQTLVGFNVSGLLWHDSQRSRDAFGLRVDYRSLVLRTLRELLSDDSVRVALIPHVIEPPGHFESDPQACDEVRSLLIKERPQLSERIRTLSFRTAPEAKGFISQCEWFCGTRMHSAIAGLSSGVPTAAIAYSVKTSGVFATCGMAEHVADPRGDSADVLVDQLVESFRQRLKVAPVLKSRLSSVLTTAESQMDEIAEIADEARLARTRSTAA